MEYLVFYVIVIGGFVMKMKVCLIGVALLGILVFVLPTTRAQEARNTRAATSDASIVPLKALDLDLSDTALVFTDPQNDFLSPKGVAWGVVGKSVTANNTVENIERLFKAAKQKGMLVAISPHYYYPQDHHWENEGALETLMHNIKMFDRTSPLSTEGFEGSGSDWLEIYKSYINDGKTIVSHAHKIYGPETNDLMLQLRKRGIRKVILGGMSANLCTESHMRELVERGFTVIVVKDATAAAQPSPDLDGYKAALINFRMIASGVWTTDEAVKQIANMNGEPKVAPTPGLE
jgi:biuret amidohydrolase